MLATPFLYTQFITVYTDIRSIKRRIKMLKGEKLIYIKHERNKGISKKSGNEYDIANVTLSNGLVSFKIDVKPYLTETPDLQELRMGDKVNVVVDVEERYNTDVFYLSDIKKVG